MENKDTSLSVIYLNFLHLRVKRRKYPRGGCTFFLFLALWMMFAFAKTGFLMVVVYILIFLFSIIAGFGVVSLLITYLFSEPIFTWCRKRWLRVLKENASESAMSNYLYERLAKDQMKSLFSEVEFHLIQVLVPLSLGGYLMTSLYADLSTKEILMSSLIPPLFLISYFGLLRKKYKLFVMDEPSESQGILSFYTFILIGVAIFFINVVNFSIEFPLREKLDLGKRFIDFLSGSLAGGVVTILFTFGRIGIIQLNKRIPLRAHEEQTDRLIQDLFLHCPDFTRRWLLLNMEHQDPKVATFAQKWVTKYL